jgi:2-succinyl-6-hydroxy-2,4-cyclohexadiene-1-carboxylate synthase
MAVIRRKITRRDIANQVWAHTWPSDQLVLGSSRMIREFDSIVPGKKIPVWSNRGLSGIDGTVATSRGIAAGRALAGLSGVTRVVLGDLAFLHDAGALLLQKFEQRSQQLQIVIVTDGGGSLFDSLEVADTADKSAYERVIFTPARAEVESLAAAYGWIYRRVVDHGGLLEALAEKRNQSVVECVVDRAGP